jgi:hypothetical protein
MKKIILSLTFCSIGLLSLAQANTLNSTDSKKENVNKSSTKSIGGSQKKPISKARMARKVKPVIRKENYEVVPQKD